MIVYEVSYQLMNQVMISYVCPKHFATRSMPGPTMPTEQVRGPVDVADARCIQCETDAAMEKVAPRQGFR